MDARETDAVLVQEYMQLQKVVEDYDLRALTIKAWSVTFSAAALGTAYVQHQPPLLFVAGLSAFVFWIVEALWKTNQQAYYSRVWEIERYFQADGTAEQAKISPLGIGRSWQASFKLNGEYRLAWRVMRWPHVALPHVVIVVVGLVLFGVSVAGGSGVGTESAPPRAELRR
jgi:hypothetical protein